MDRFLRRINSCRKIFYTPFRNVSWHVTCQISTNFNLSTLLTLILTLMNFWGTMFPLPYVANFLSCPPTLIINQTIILELQCNTSTDLLWIMSAFNQGQSGRYRNPFSDFWVKMPNILQPWIQVQMNTTSTSLMRIEDHNGPWEMGEKWEWKLVTTTKILYISARNCTWCKARWGFLG